MSQLLVFPAWDQRLDAVLPKPIPHAVVAVALIARQLLWPFAWSSQRLRDGNLIHHRLNARRFVRLPGGHFDRQRQASTVSHQVELAAESASRAAQSVVFRLFRVAPAAFLEAPAAARLARTDEPSMHHRSQSIVPSASSRMCRASRMRSYTPSVRHFQKWSYTVCHGPNRSGRSRQGDPVRRIHRIPLSINRGSDGGRPVIAVRLGRIG